MYGDIGSHSPSSFRLFSQIVKGKMSTERLREFFDAADKDDNGCISTEELVNILTKALEGDRQSALSLANVSQSFL